MPRHGTALPEPAATGPDGMHAAGPLSTRHRPGSDAEWGVSEQIASAQRETERQRGMASWPISRKLTTLVGVPLAVLLVIFGIIGFQSFQDVRSAQRTRGLAELALATNSFSGAMQRERSLTLTVQGSGGNEENKAKLKQYQQESDGRLQTLKRVLEETTSKYPSDDIDIAAARVDDALERVPGIREVTGTERNPETVLRSFAPVFEGLAALSDTVTRELTNTAADQRAADGAATLSALTQTAAAAAEEQDILTLALTQKQLSISRYHQLGMLNNLQRQRLDVAEERATKRQFARIVFIRGDDTRLDLFRRDAVQADCTVGERSLLRIGKCLGQQLGTRCAHAHG